MTSAVIIDYGIVNLKNIYRGFESVGARVESSVDPNRVRKADRVVLPGVGAFESGMKELQALGMDEAVKHVADAGRPILGICLGMQMLLETSTEYGRHLGLGLIGGSVLPIPTGEEGQLRRKIPHIGWNALQHPHHGGDWANSCLRRTPVDTFFYFVHSFMAVPDDDTHVLGQCAYEGLRLTGAIKKGDVTGLQFHPERSGPAGLEVLRNFVFP